MIVNRLTLRFALAALCFTGLAHAQTTPAVPQPESIQSLDVIRRAAESAVRGAIDPALGDVKLDPVALDPRLRLASCARKLDSMATPPKNAQSRVIARISCASPVWTLNVPVEVRRTHDVLILRRAVGRGESIAAADVVTQRREMAGLGSPFVSRPQDLSGRLTRRPLPEGTAVTAESLAAALLIKRGQQVTLVAQSSGFEVRAPGKAITDAAANQRVRVQNLNSLKIIEGIADTDGTVRVQP